MLAQTIQWTIISLVLIILVHYLYSFFIDTLTVPKVRDLINKPAERYNEILSMPTSNSKPEQAINQQDMQEELKDFMSKLKKDSQPTAPQAANNSMDLNAYSSY